MNWCVPTKSGDKSKKVQGCQGPRRVRSQQRPSRVGFRDDGGGGGLGEDLAQKGRRPVVAGRRWPRRQMVNSEGAAF